MKINFLYSELGKDAQYENSFRNKKVLFEAFFDLIKPNIDTVKVCILNLNVSGNDRPSVFITPSKVELESFIFENKRTVYDVCVWEFSNYSECCEFIPSVLESYSDLTYIK